jgi:hypothetical protein
VLPVPGALEQSGVNLENRTGDCSSQAFKNEDKNT